MKKKLLSILIGICIIVCAVFLFNYLKSTKPTPHQKEAKPNILGVKTCNVKYSTINVPFIYPGRVSSLDIVKLGSEVQGRMIEGDVLLKEGQSFKKGQLLVDIFSDDVEATLRAQKSSYLNTLSTTLPDIKIDFTKEYSKWYNFFTSIDINKPLPKLPELHSSKEKVFVAVKNLLTDYYNIKQAEINLSKYKVFAPFNGTFLSVEKEVGSIASVGSEIGTIIRTDNLEIIVPVLPQDSYKLKKGNHVKIHLAGNETVNGKISRMSPFVDSETQSINVYISAPNNKKILDGQFINVEFAKNELKQVLQLPREALVDQDMVYNVKDNKIYPIKVNIVRKGDDYIYINGIEEGKMIVKESLVNAYPGMSINPIQD